MPEAGCCEYKRGMGVVPPITANGNGQLELRLAGIFGVVRNGVPLPDRELGSRKARTLLNAADSLASAQSPGEPAPTQERLTAQPPMYASWSSLNTG